jgi:hypothetical protein
MAPSACVGSRERCLFASVMMLGALFGLMASPAARAPLVSLFVIVGIPLLTFAVAAPTRLGLVRELALLFRGLEAVVLVGLCAVVGRGTDARAVLLRHRVRVENAYASDGGRLAAAVAGDPERLHHNRRLGALATALTVLAGVALPYVFPQTYTYGAFPVAPLVFLVDLTVLAVVGRIVSERMMIRLFEATHALAGGHPTAARFRVVPLSGMLGAAMGAVGALVVLAAAAGASALETSWIFGDVDLLSAGFWFIRETAPVALPLGIAIGGVVGVGSGLAQPPEA